MTEIISNRFLVNTVSKHTLHLYFVKVQQSSPAATGQYSWIAMTKYYINNALENVLKIVKIYFPSEEDWGETYHVVF